MFERDPIKGILLGLGIALTIIVLVEATRWYRHQRRPDPESSLESTA